MASLAGFLPTVAKTASLRYIPTMNPCPECKLAESNPVHVLFTGQLCCAARGLVESPKRFRRERAAALKAAIEPDQWEQVKARIDVLMKPQ